MRIVVKFKADLFPLAHSGMGISVVKETVKFVDEDYYKELYEGAKKSKNFSFSFYIKDYVKEGDMFVKNDGIYMTISTPDIKLGIALYNGFNNKDEFRYKNFILKRESIKIEHEPKVVSDSVIIKALSPIVVRAESNNNYLTIDDEAFMPRLNYVMDIALKNLRGYGLTEQLKLIPIKAKKVVVKQSLREYKEIANKDTFYLDGTLGTFQLKGSIHDLDTICQLGLGFKRGQGFGNVKVV